LASRLATARSRFIGAIVGLGLLALLTRPDAAHAGVVGPSNCTVPAGIYLVGSKAGVPDPAGLFSVTVRDLANNPMPNLQVEIDFANTPDLSPASVQLYPGLTVKCGATTTVSRLTDANGVASFIIMGSARNLYSVPGTVGGQVVVRAAGTTLATVIGAAFDLDGANGVNGDDVAIWLCDFGGSQNFGRDDYDFTGGVGATDISRLFLEISSGNSTESATPCGGAPDLPATVQFSGGLSLGWDDCRQLSGVVDKQFNCASNAGVFHLIGSVTPPIDFAQVTVVEADVDIVNPAGVLPDWWKFQPLACRQNGFTSQDPNNDLAITCTVSGASQGGGITSVLYPYNGNPNAERIHVITAISNGGTALLSADQTTLLDFAISKLKSTGPGLCAGCNVPVDITLASVRLSRGDPCTTSADSRPGPVVFTQSPGLNVVHWQSVTPTFPIAINATTLSDPQFRISVGPCLDASSIQNLTMVAGSYSFLGCSGGQFPFTVDGSGHVQYDPSLQGLVTGAGTSTLVVHDALIAVDAHVAPPWTYNVDAHPCFVNTAIQSLRLIPGTHFVGICAGTCVAMEGEELEFVVDGAGHVTYAAVSQGALGGSGTSTLLVKSFTFPPGGDDVTQSMGMFRVIVEPQFWTLMAGYPGYGVVNGVHRLVSPVMFDNATLIGRSSIHQDGDAADLAGVPVGSAKTIISDASFSLVPPGFAGPPGIAEVHTEIRSLNMTSGGAAVRAGINAPGRPISPGEIEANAGVTGLFPAESFFNVFVEVDLPVLGTLYNSDPLMVENSGITCFPPGVVYIHRHTGPVPIRFKASNPPYWQAGDRFGWLVLAGHGVNLDDLPPGPAKASGPLPTGHRSIQDLTDTFLAIVNTEPEMADTATLVVDVHDVITFSSPSAFTQPQFRDSLMAGMDRAAAFGHAGNPCAGLFEATRMYQRVDSLPLVTDWVSDQAVRHVLAGQFLAMSAQLLAQANQSGGCNGVTATPPPAPPTRLALLGIHYAVPVRERVSLAVFDLSGRMVRSLVDAELSPGVYQAVWDGHQDRAGGRTVSSGAYFVRLMAGGLVYTRRVVVVR
jgi:hypothetical protein